MSFLIRVPKLSLGLLLLTYSVFGWQIGEVSSTLARENEWQEAIARLAWLESTPSFSNWLLSSSTAYWGLWVIVIVCVLLFAGAFTTPIKLIRTCFGGWLQSDTSAFVSIMGLSFAAVVMFCWIEAFTSLVIIFATGALARLDLQREGCGEWQAFTILTLLSFIGIGLGWLSYGFFVKFL
ncbi:MAG: hypothetical protein WA865_07585 [Spirulinaceae cyanobacterium]